MSTYDILGVPLDATDDQIRKAFRAKAKERHPDLNPGNPHAGESMTELNLAYSCLADPAKRSAYDLTLANAARERAARAHAARERAAWADFEAGPANASRVHSGQPNAHEQIRENGMQLVAEGLRTRTWTPSLLGAGLLFAGSFLEYLVEPPRRSPGEAA